MGRPTDDGIVVPIVFPESPNAQQNSRCVYMEVWGWGGGNDGEGAGLLLSSTCFGCLWEIWAHHPLSYFVTFLFFLISSRPLFLEPPSLLCTERVASCNNPLLALRGYFPCTFIHPLVAEETLMSVRLLPGGGWKEGEALVVLPQLCLSASLMPICREGNGTLVKPATCRRMRPWQN